MPAPCLNGWANILRLAWKPNFGSMNEQTPRRRVGLGSSTAWQGILGCFKILNATSHREDDTPNSMRMWTQMQFASINTLGIRPSTKNWKGKTSKQRKWHDCKLFVFPALQTNCDEIKYFELMVQHRSELEWGSGRKAGNKYSKSAPGKFHSNSTRIPLEFYSNSIVLFLSFL